MTPRYVFTYNSNPESEGRMFDDLARVLAANSVELETAQCLTLAVSEAFTNAIIHGNRRDAAMLVSIDLRVNKCEIAADITDQGHGGLERVNTRKPPTPLGESGRGIDLIQHYATSVKFSEDTSGGLVVSIRVARQEGHKKNVRSFAPEEAMETTMRELGSVAVLDLRGRLDLASGSRLKDDVKKLFESNFTLIHLNLAEVEFINSSGLGALVSIMKEIRLRKGRLTLSDLASYVQEIFDITQLSHIFEIFPSEEEALASFQLAISN